MAGIVHAHTHCVYNAVALLYVRARQNQCRRPYSVTYTVKISRAYAFGDGGGGETRSDDHLFVCARRNALYRPPHLSLAACRLSPPPPPPPPKPNGAPVYLPASSGPKCPHKIVAPSVRTPAAATAGMTLADMSCSPSCSRAHGGNSGRDFSAVESRAVCKCVCARSRGEG